MRTTALFGLLLVACSAASIDDSASSNAALVERLSVVPARDWAKCWTTPDGAKIAVLCTAFEAPAKYPFVVTDITAHVRTRDLETSDDVELLADKKSKGPAIAIGSWSTSQFPITLSLAITPDDDQPAFSSTNTIQALVTVQATLPFEHTFTQPFDLLPAVFSAQGRTDRDKLSILFADYDLPLGELTYNGTNRTRHVHIKPYNGDSEESDGRWFAIAPGAKVNGTAYLNLRGGAIVQSEASWPIALDAGGHYVLTASGLRPATDDDALPPAQEEFVVYQAPPRPPPAAPPADGGVD